MPIPIESILMQLCILNFSVQLTIILYNVLVSIVAIEFKLDVGKNYYRYTKKPETPF